MLICKQCFLADVVSQAAESRRFCRYEKAGADAWIGLYDFLIERDFVWLSTRAEPDFTHWGHAEPDNYNEQDCVRMLSDGYWDDVGCGESRWPVCEMT